MRTAHRRPAIQRRNLPTKRRPAREVSPIELAAAVPVTVAVLSPAEIAVRTGKTLPKFVLPLPKRAKAEAAKSGADQRTARVKNGRKHTQEFAKAGRGIGVWETRVMPAAGETPLSPGWVQPGSIVVREEPSPHFDEVASFWQTTVVYGDSAAQESEASAVLTWGYVIRIAP